MVDGFASGDNISIIVNPPIWSSSFRSIPNEIENYNSYTHTIKALGGYWNASINISTSKAVAEDWYSEGIGKDVRVYNPSNILIWNGFVNRITLQMGTIVAERGPLLGVANKVKSVYTPVETSASPPILGVRESTAYAQDTPSQDKYGIIEKVLSVGSSPASQAQQIRDRFLDENKDPETSENISLGSSQNPTVTLEILGYVHWLDLFTYSSTTSGTRTYSLRIQDILGSEPNSIFSSDYGAIDTNSLTVSRYDDNDRKAWQIIKSIVAHGDSSDNRWVFGIYGDDRKAYYRQAPDSTSYLHQILDQRQRITDRLSGEDVRPYDLLPAKWLNVSDFLIGSRLITGDIRQDPRSIFIESVTYTTPYGLQINGMKLETLPQMLSKLGITGIGA